MIVHVAEAYLDYERSCILGVYDTNQRARKRIHAINEGPERWDFNRYAISSWLVGETLPFQKTWLYPAGGTLFEQKDLVMPGNEVAAQRSLPDVWTSSAKDAAPNGHDTRVLLKWPIENKLW